MEEKAVELTGSAEDLVRQPTQEEVRAFAEDGWVKLDHFISPDLAAALLTAAQALMGFNGDEHVARRGVDINFDWWPEYQLPGLEGMEPFRSLAFHPSIGRAAHALGVRRDVGVRYMRDQIACRLPAGSAKDRPAPPHQDFSGAIFDRVGYVNFWIALNDIPPERGSMRFYNGSHKEGLLGWRNKSGDLTPADRPLLDVYPDLVNRCPKSPPLHLKPGDATAHHMLTVHEAPQNTTDTPRWSCINLYFPSDAVYIGNTYGGVDEALTIGECFTDERFPVIWDPSLDADPVNG